MSATATCPRPETEPLDPALDVVDTLDEGIDLGDDLADATEDDS